MANCTCGIRNYYPDCDVITLETGNIKVTIERDEHGEVGVTVFTEGLTKEENHEHRMVLGAPDSV
jgi:hypothetical protein